MVMIVWKLDLQLPVQSVSITTKVVSSNPVHGEVYSIQHYVIKFVSGLRWVGGFIKILRFPPPIKLTATIWLKYCWKWQCRFILFLLQFFQMYNAYVLFQLSFLPDTNDWQASILYPIWLKLHVCSIFFSFFGDALASKDILQWVTSGFIFSGSRHDRGCMVVGFTTTCVISAYHHKSCEFEPCSRYNIMW